MTVWRVRNRDGYGYVRELVDGRPIVTADKAEAAQYGTLADALIVVRALRRVPRLVPFVPAPADVDGPPRVRYQPTA